MKHEIVVVESQGLQRRRGESTYRREQSEVGKIQRFHEGVGDAAPNEPVYAAAASVRLRPVVVRVVERRGMLRALALLKMLNGRASHLQIECTRSGEREVTERVRVEAV